MSARYPIIVYGATGYSGALVARELSRRGANFAIAGRDRAKLVQLQASLPSDPDILVASLDDPAALEQMASRGRVVLSCAGPFVDYGPPVQRAALAAGAHFLDITGEAGYMLDTWRSRDAEARARGVAIVNAVGFDVISSDFPAWLACQGLGPVDKVEIAIAALGEGTSQGTQRSALRATLGTSLGYEQGEWIEVPPGRFRREVGFPSPVGRSSCVSMPWGDIATAPRSTGAQTVRVYFRLPKHVTRVLPFVAPLARVARHKPIYALLQRRIAAGPAGPSDEQRARSKFMVWAEATAVDGRQKSVVLSGPGGYDFTALAASEAALRASSPEFEKRGVLTPSQAFDVPAFLKALEDRGVKLLEQG